MSKTNAFNDCELCFKRYKYYQLVDSAFVSRKTQETIKFGNFG